MLLLNSREPLRRAYPGKWGEGSTGKIIWVLLAERGEKKRKCGLKKNFFIKKNLFKNLMWTTMSGQRRRGETLTHRPEPGAEGPPPSGPRSLQSYWGRPRPPPTPPEKSGLCDLLTLPGAGKTAETPSPLALWAALMLSEEGASGNSWLK